MNNSIKTGILLKDGFGCLSNDTEEVSILMNTNKYYFFCILY